MLTEKLSAFTKIKVSSHLHKANVDLFYNFLLQNSKQSICLWTIKIQINRAAFYQFELFSRTCEHGSSNLFLILFSVTLSCFPIWPSCCWRESSCICRTSCSQRSSPEPTTRQYIKIQAIVICPALLIHPKLNRTKLHMHIITRILIEILSGNCRILFLYQQNAPTSNLSKRSFRFLKASRQVGWNILCWSNSSYMTKSTKVIWKEVHTHWLYVA